nr:hypothetical protein [Streptomyces chartreusis]
MKATRATLRTMTALVEAEAARTAALRAETRTRTAQEKAKAAAKTARAEAATARRELRKALRAGQGIAAAQRTADSRTARAERLTERAHTARATATQARRAARTAERAYNRCAFRAAVAAGQTVDTIVRHLGEVDLTPAVETDPQLTADQVPPVAEIEAHAARHADLDAQAKDLAKLADAEKQWLRRLPSGAYGRVVIARTPTGSVLDTGRVALDYSARSAVPPRKAKRHALKVDASALLADLAREAVDQAPPAAA